MHKLAPQTDQRVHRSEVVPDFGKKRPVSVGKKMRVTLSEEGKRKRAQREVREMEELLCGSDREDSLFYESGQKDREGRGESLNSSVVRWQDNSVQKVSREWGHLFTISSASEQVGKSSKKRASNKLAGLE